MEKHEVKIGDLITILDWRSSTQIQVYAISDHYWDPDRECWAFDYEGAPELPGYAVWVEDHWEDGEH